jgi:hypothetical protein
VIVTLKLNIYVIPVAEHEDIMKIIQHCGNHNTAHYHSSERVNDGLFERSIGCWQLEG